MTLINQKDSLTFNHLPIKHYDNLLNQKVMHLQNLLTPFTDIKINTNIDVHFSVDDVDKKQHQAVEDMAVFTSPTSNFRMRAEFGIWHEGDDCNYIMTEHDEHGNKLKVKIDEFPIAGKAINVLMPILLNKIKSNPLLKQKLFQIEFLSTLSDDMLVTLIYHKRLEDDWQQLAQQLEIDLGCHIIGRSRKQKLVLSQDFVIEKLQILNQIYTYKQLEGGFTQPNAKVCQSMLTWACEQAQSISTHSQPNHQSEKVDLLELYCGNANFTLPLSQYFNKVLATEISKTSVYSAQWNIEQNKALKGVDNISIARLSAEEFTQALTGEREFRRLKQAGIQLADYKFSTVFVDPPRAGIDDDTLKLLSEFDNIIYISCNPNTLADNLQMLCKTHTLISSALFDQFPYTQHIEAGVMLRKK